MQEAIVIDSSMMEAIIHSKMGVLSSRNETRMIGKTQEVNAASSVNIPMMEAMNHNRMYVSSSTNGVEKSGAKHKIQGTVVGFKMMEAINHIKIGVVKSNKGQEKKRKVQDHHRETLYAKW